MGKFLPLAAANEFIARSDGRGLTHMQLQKLVYLAHEQWLKSNNEPFLSENPQVWQYGPVFSGLYQELKNFRKDEIKEQQKLFDEPPLIDEPDVNKVIDDTWRAYQGKSGVWLSDLTHRPGSIWRILAERYDFKVPYGLEIKPADIISVVRK